MCQLFLFNAAHPHFLLDKNVRDFAIQTTTGASDRCWAYDRRRFAQLKTNYKALISVTTDLLDLLEAGIRGQHLDPGVLPRICSRLQAVHEHNSPPDDDIEMESDLDGEDTEAKDVGLSGATRKGVQKPMEACVNRGAATVGDEYEASKDRSHEDSFSFENGQSVGATGEWAAESGVEKGLAAQFDGLRVIRMEAVPTFCASVGPNGCAELTSLVDEVRRSFHLDDSNRHTARAVESPDFIEPNSEAQEVMNSDGEEVKRPFTSGGCVANVSRHDALILMMSPTEAEHVDSRIEDTVNQEFYRSQPRAVVFWWDPSSNLFITHLTSKWK
ncbi:unnamed protein product [Protopolystoma xenopodis]|uniref:Uncharacterized protein n=1 Tax=Protopolystoma xenopodis TaxID=117903 RepID=A0A3S5FCD1_9PLAT|nr:unnamed protein product [Protopolystoma xenopodis]